MFFTYQELFQTATLIVLNRNDDVENSIRDVGNITHDV